MRGSAETPLALFVIWSLHRRGSALTTASRDPVRTLRTALFLSLLLVALSGGPFLSHDGFGVPVVLAVVPFLAASIGGLAVA